MKDLLSNKHFNQISKFSNFLHKKQIIGNLSHLSSLKNKKIIPFNQIINLKLSINNKIFNQKEIHQFFSQLFLNLKLVIKKKIF